MVKTCEICGGPIGELEPTAKSGNSEYHRRCYDARHGIVSVGVWSPSSFSVTVESTRPLQPYGPLKTSVTIEMTNPDPDASYDGMVEALDRAVETAMTRINMVSDTEDRGRIKRRIATPRPRPEPDHADEQDRHMDLGGDANGA